MKWTRKKKGMAVHHFYFKSKNFSGQAEGNHENIRAVLRVETRSCGLPYAQYGVPS